MATPEKKLTWFDLNEDKALGLLLDYYNMRLEIIEADGKLNVSDEEFKKITNFFDKHLWLYILPPITAQDFDEKFPHPYWSFDALKRLHEDAFQESDGERRQEILTHLEICLLTYTRGEASDNRPEGASGIASHSFWRALWRDSNGFHDFLSDYQRVTTLVKAAVEKQELHREDLRWIEALGQKLHATLKPAIAETAKVRMSSSERTAAIRSDKIDLRKMRIVEGRYSPYNWYDADFGRFVYFLYRGLLQLLRGEITIKACTFPYCGKIFFVSPQGRYEHKFCSEDCRKHEERRPYYERLAADLAEWLQIQEERTYTAKALAESFGQYVCEKHDPDFSLTPHQIGIEFQAKNLDRYLERHGFRCKREGERRPYHYVFETFNRGECATIPQKMSN